VFVSDTFRALCLGIKSAVYTGKVAPDPRSYWRVFQRNSQLASSSARREDSEYVSASLRERSFCKTFNTSPCVKLRKRQDEQGRSAATIQIACRSAWLRWQSRPRIAQSNVFHDLKRSYQRPSDVCGRRCAVVSRGVRHLARLPLVTKCKDSAQTDGVPTARNSVTHDAIVASVHVLVLLRQFPRGCRNRERGPLWKPGKF
jgi:hypothetical protein